MTGGRERFQMGASHQVESVIGGWCDRREGAVSDGGVTPRTYPIPPCFALGIMIDPVGTSASPVLNDASVTRREVIWAASSPQVWPEGLLQSYVAEV